MMYNIGSKLIRRLASRPCLYSLGYYLNPFSTGFNSSNTLTIKSTYIPYLSQKRYAGHSKWANIRHTKAAKDTERSQKTARHLKIIEIAMRDGKDPFKNDKLRTAIEIAIQDAVPKVTVESFLKKAQVKDGSKIYKIGIRGPGGSIFVATVLTSQPVRFKQLLTSSIKKLGGTITDSVVSCFQEKGNILAQKTMDIDEALEHAIEIGAEEVIEEMHNDEPALKFITSPENLLVASSKLKKNNFTILESSTNFIPMATVSLEESELLSNLKLYERLRMEQDILEIYDNIA